MSCVVAPPLLTFARSLESQPIEGLAAVVVREAAAPAVNHLETAAIEGATSVTNEGNDEPTTRCSEGTVDATTEELVVGFYVSTAQEFTPATLGEEEVPITPAEPPALEDDAVAGWGVAGVFESAISVDVEQLITVDTVATVDAEVAEEWHLEASAVEDGWEVDSVADAAVDIPVGMLVFISSYVYESLVFVAAQELAVWVLIITAVGFAGFIFRMVVNLAADVAVGLWQRMAQWRCARAHARQDVARRLEHQPPAHPQLPKAPTSSRFGATGAAGAARSAASSRSLSTRRKARRTRISIPMPPIVLNSPLPDPDPENRPGPRAVSPTRAWGAHEMSASSSIHTHAAEEIFGVSDPNTLGISGLLAISATQRHQRNQAERAGEGVQKRLFEQHISTKEEGTSSAVTFVTTTGTQVGVRTNTAVVVWQFVNRRMNLKCIRTRAGVRHLFV